MTASISSDSDKINNCRTISEGNHMEPYRRGRGKPSISSGSPMSPSPGSCVSSESAGSSNSLDDADYGGESRRHSKSCCVHYC